MYTAIERLVAEMALKLVRAEVKRWTSRARPLGKMVMPEGFEHIKSPARPAYAWPRLVGEYCGLPLALEFIPQGMGGKCRLVLELLLPMPLDLSLSPPDSLLGLGGPWWTEVRELGLWGEMWQSSSSQPQEAAQFLASPGVGELIEDMRPFQRLSAQPRYLRLTWSALQPQDLELALCERRLEALVRFALALRGEDFSE